MTLLEQQFGFLYDFAVVDNKDLHGKFSTCTHEQRNVLIECVCNIEVFTSCTKTIRDCHKLLKIYLKNKWEGLTKDQVCNLRQIACKVIRKVLIGEILLVFACDEGNASYRSDSLRRIDESE